MRIKKITYNILIIIAYTLLFPIGSKAKQNLSFTNEEQLNNIFEKLYNLETGRQKKVNIVHIGDSHIQADFFTDAIRQPLQRKFGNGGYGFTFPHSLAKTNGTKYVKYKSNEQWQSFRNIEPISNTIVGLSGIALYTHSNNFYIELQADYSYWFNTIKILYPSNEPCFDLALDVEYDKINKPTVQTIQTTKNVYHKVKEGETLYRISVNYKVSVEALKKANNLRSNTIKIGQNIKIPTNTKNVIRRTNTENIAIKKDSVLPLENMPYASVYNTFHPLGRIFILPNGKSNNYNLNGIILENDRNGLIYHTIGVNGTKTSDYNKHSVFFEQLPILNPDLIIISLGTNESFGKWSKESYISEIKLLVENIRRNKDIPVLIMTPPPSMFRRTIPNTRVEEYSKALLEIKDCIIWDLFSKMGGLSAPQKKKNMPFMAKDKVHYTKEGYQMQGELFSSDFLNSYNNYIKKK